MEQLEAIDGPYSSNATAPKDIVQQIKDLYMPKRCNVEKEQMLIPTKASLFGLDVRFRQVDAKNAQEKMRRSVFKKAVQAGTTGGRHKLPVEGRFLSEKMNGDETIKQLQQSAEQTVESGEVSFTRGTAKNPKTSKSKSLASDPKIEEIPANRVLEILAYLDKIGKN